jgi:hypothetical protein
MDRNGHTELLSIVLTHTKHTIISVFITITMFVLSRSRLMMLTSASFVLTLHQISASRPESAVCETPTKNSAFVFIKPHANTPDTQRLVADTFKSKGIKVLTEGELTGEQIDAVSYQP